MHHIHPFEGCQKWQSCVEWATHEIPPDRLVWWRNHQGSTNLIPVKHPWQIPTYSAKHKKNLLIKILSTSNHGNLSSEKKKKKKTFRDCKFLSTHPPMVTACFQVICRTTEHLQERLLVTAFLLRIKQNWRTTKDLDLQFYYKRVCMERNII